MADETSWGHRSKNWGGKFHVDKYVKDEAGNVIDHSDGHSPTLNPPPREDGAIKIKDIKDLPSPYGKI